MKNILAIGASNSKRSINKRLALYVAGQVHDATVTVADLRELDLPLYSPDLEAESGVPENAHIFRSMIENADGIVLSLAEYNGMVTAAFKNMWDWASRIDSKIWQDKPILLMAASPGGRGGGNVLQGTKKLMPFFGGKVVADFSLPFFFEHFSENGLKDSALNEDLNAKIQRFQTAIEA